MSLDTLLPHVPSSSPMCTNGPTPQQEVTWTLLPLWGLEGGFFLFAAPEGTSPGSGPPPASPSSLSRGTSATFGVKGFTGNLLPLSVGFPPLLWPFGLFPTSGFAVMLLRAYPSPLPALTHSEPDLAPSTSPVLSPDQEHDQLGVGVWGLF